MLSRKLTGKVSLGSSPDVRVVSPKSSNSNKSGATKGGKERSKSRKKGKKHKESRRGSN